MLELKLFIYYGSWLVFPFVAWVFYKRRIVWILLSLLFIYARFVEPKMLWVHHYDIDVGFSAKYALVADIHLGIYNDESILEKIIDRVNQLDVDALLIAGDLTYEADPNELKTLFDSFSKSKVPIYAVLGNHDCEKPGPKIRDKLEEILSSLGVKIITNRSIELNGITILGLGSHWASDDRVGLIDDYKKEERLIVLTHNPDTVLDFNTHNYPDLTLAGHTHGGQIRIPYFYQKVIPVKGDVLWDKGVMSYNDTQVFVTSGVGMIGLPLRFLIPPTIDILTLH